MLLLVMEIGGMVAYFGQDFEKHKTKHRVQINQTTNPEIRLRIVICCFDVIKY